MRMQEQAFRLISQYQDKYEADVNEVAVAQSTIDAGVESLVTKLKGEPEYAALLEKYLDNKKDMEVCGCAWGAMWCVRMLCEIVY